MTYVAPLAGKLCGRGMEANGGCCIEYPVIEGSTLEVDKCHRLTIVSQGIPAAHSLDRILLQCG